ncbi:MAG: single-stranded DNA-binding protein [Patescibacteria group bacterium]
MNKIILVGRLVANPEFKINESGTKIGKLRIAVDNNKNTLFINVVYFDKLAEVCQKYLTKGRKILVDGRLDYRETEEGNYYSVIANEIDFLDKPKEQND